MLKYYNIPFQTLVWSRRKRVTLDHFAYFFFTEAEVLYGPHVAELVHSEVRVAPALSHRGGRTPDTVFHLSLGLGLSHISTA